MYDNEKSCACRFTPLVAIGSVWGITGEASLAIAVGSVLGGESLAIQAASEERRDGVC